jgi:type II secretory pathway component GspD/PulD (secretin)
MKTFVISGSTVEPGVILGGFPGGTRIESDSSGSYRAEVPFGWKGTITPQKPGFSFAPPSISYAEGVKADLTNQDYTPQPKTFVISGSVGMPGVSLAGFPESVVSDEKGNYRAVVHYQWTGEVTPTKDGFEFAPKSKQYTVGVTRDYENEIFKGAPITYEISGTITVGGTPLANVKLQGLPGDPVTTTAGTYTVRVGFDWSGSATPVREGYNFEPGMQNYSHVTAPMTGQDYAGTAIQYTLSGTVGIEGVDMRGLNVKSGPDGQYSANVAHGWSGKVTPTLEGYGFTPTEIPYTKVVANQSGQDYVAKEIVVTIQGNAGQGNVVLEGLLGADGQTLISDSKGAYTAKVRFGQSLVIAPKKEGFTFKPENITVAKATRDLSMQNFMAGKLKFVVSGNVGQADVEMKGFPSRVVSQKDGSYQTTVNYGDTFTVIPTKGGYEFDPPSLAYTDVREPKQNQDYTAREKRCKISGKITMDGSGFDGVTVFTGIGETDVKSVTTEASGDYTLEVPFNWSGTIQFLKEGYDFVPINQKVSQVAKDLNFDFTAKVKMLTITSDVGAPIEGATVTADPSGAKATTDKSGKFRIQVPYDWTGTITPTKEGYEFDPPNKPYEHVKTDLDETLSAKNATPPASQQTAGPGATESAQSNVAPGGSTHPATGGPAGAVQPQAGGQNTAAGPGPTGQGSITGQSGTKPSGLNPEAELRVAQLQKEIDDLKAKAANGGAAGTGKAGEKVAGTSAMPPKGSLGPIVSTPAFLQIDIRIALADISTDTGVPIITDPSVGGDVTVSVTGKPLEQALDLLLAGTEFSWRRMEYFYLVTTSKVTSPSFLQGSETRTVHLGQIDANEAVKMLSPAVQPYVQPQVPGRTVNITAPARMIDRIEADLRALDARPRQVLLEAKIVSLEKGNLLNLGVDWAWPTAKLGTFGSSAKGASSNTLTDYNGKWPWGVQIGYAADGTFTSALEMALNLLEENSEARILSRPQMFAQSGKKAEFSVMTEEYFMMTPNIQASSSLGFMSSLAQLENVKSGTRLTITPYIADNNEITLDVAVELSDSIAKARGTDLPKVTRRITSNTVTVRDGGTVAVAGLNESRTRTKESKVPGLSDIPIMGKLFTNNDNDKDNREVAVFITANLVREGRYNAPAESAPAGRSPAGESNAASPFSDQLKDALGRRSR